LDIKAHIEMKWSEFSFSRMMTALRSSRTSVVISHTQVCSQKLRHFMHREGSMPSY